MRAQKLNVHSANTVIVGLITATIAHVQMLLMITVIFVNTTTFWASLACVFS
ncbi:hypothetical protein FC25_GL002061 [Ligilactobacillus ruminis DSM 20403 = NBRC 102161]|nr:hypothetical protein FC25_GL002061 [Ligilactobacillus ruminis DSM 20403 = NBRC 102161]